MQLSLVGFVDTWEFLQAFKWVPERGGSRKHSFGRGLGCGAPRSEVQQERSRGFSPPNGLGVWESVMSSPSGVRDWALAENVFRASRLDVCRKLTSCQNTFVNGKTIAFDRLERGSPLLWIRLCAGTKKLRTPCGVLWRLKAGKWRLSLCRTVLCRTCWVGCYKMLILCNRPVYTFTLTSRQQYQNERKELKSKYSSVDDNIVKVGIAISQHDWEYFDTEARRHLPEFLRNSTLTRLTGWRTASQTTHNNSFRDEPFGCNRLHRY